MADRSGGFRSGPVRTLLHRRRDRIGTLAISATAILASFAEAYVLVALSVSALRLTSDNMGSLSFPGGFDVSEMSGSRLILSGLLALSVRAVALVGNSVVSARLIESMTWRWRRRLFLSFQRARWDVQAARDEGYLQTLVQGHTNRVGSVMLQLTKAITAATSFSVFIAGAFVLEPRAAFGLVLFGVLLALVLRPILGLSRRTAVRQREAGNEFARLLGETETLSMEHRVFGVEDRVSAGVLDQLDRQRRAGVVQRMLMLLTPQLYSIAGYVAMLGGVFVATSVGVGDPAAIGGVVLLMIRSIGYGQTLQATAQGIASSRPFIDELAATSSSLESAEFELGSTNPGSFRELVFDGAEISRGDQVVLSDVDLIIRSGEVIGVIGPSGGGKTTLVSAMLGLLELTGGRLLINGSTPASEASASWWRSSVAYVPQRPSLFDGSVSENIAFHRDVDADAVRRAADRANLSSDLDEWSDGLDRSVGPRGSQLSGGQQQRVSLARALAAEPSLLVLDEPTSALDGAAEEAVVHALEELRGSCTIIVVAHRLSTLRFCDRVIEVVDGSIVERAPTSPDLGPTVGLS